MLRISTEELKKLLLEYHLTTDKKIEEIEKASEAQNMSFQDLLINRRVISDKDLVRIYSYALNIPFIDLSQVEISTDLVKKLPEKVARRYQAVVFGEEEGNLLLAMSDPTDIPAVQFIEKELGFTTKIHIASSQDIGNALDLYKEGISTEISKVIQDTEELSIEESQLGEKVSAEDVQEIVQEAPIARALSIILEYAVKSRASDIHIEPRENTIQVRFRIDGVLQDTMSLPHDILSALVTRVKILSNLRIDEHRIPQDGRIKVKIGTRSVSIRVSTLPVVDGEKVVMRLLDESTKAPTLDELGYSGTALLRIKNALQKPHGMLLVTGPTGSGKSTTLYSALSMLNSIEVNISTVEDPIEYRMPGVNQTQVNTKTGMTFASGLRALLRQDPDIIMVGEIRDKETAEMAVHAALTGHVVLSTLHTNNAAGCLPRLLDMEVEPFLIASTVNAVVGQRLVRRLCLECRQSYHASKEEIEEIISNFGLSRDFIYTNPPKEVVEEVSKATKTEVGPEESKGSGSVEKVIPAPVSIAQHVSILDQIAEDPTILNRAMLKETDEGEKEVATLREKLFVPPKIEKKKDASEELSLTLYKAVGCKKCNNAGYNGRLGIYEVLEMSSKIGKMIVERETTEEIEKAAIEEGMVTMAQDGFIKSILGITTIEEILRVTRE